MLQHEELKCPKCGKNMLHGFASKAISLSFMEPCKLTKFISISRGVGSSPLLGISSKLYLAYLCSSCSIHLLCYEDVLKVKEARVLAKKLACDKE